MPIIADYSPPSVPPLFLGYKILFLQLVPQLPFCPPVCALRLFKGVLQVYKMVLLSFFIYCDNKTNNISPHRVSLYPEGLKTGVTYGNMKGK